MRWCSLSTSCTRWSAPERRKGRWTLQLLKPALARGELRCIGADDSQRIQKYIEKDAALERRFQPIYVGEPSVEDTIAILRGLKEKYEVHRTGSASPIPPCGRSGTSHRYIADRFLPDKAVDLMDEAASRACASKY